MYLDLGLILYSAATVSFLLLLFAQLRAWSRGISSLVLLLATLSSLIWCTAILFQERVDRDLFVLIPLLESFKNISWFFLLLSLLGARNLLQRTTDSGISQPGLALLCIVSLGLPLSLILYLLNLIVTQEPLLFFPLFGGKSVLLGFLVSSIVGLALLEQVVRNTRSHHFWHLKFLCLGLGILFTYDLYLYSEAALFGEIDELLWDVRGAVIVIASPFLFLGVVRTRKQPIQLNISRRLVFHTGVLIAAGLYLLVMSAAGYYIRNIEGEWGTLFKVLFWVISLCVLVVLAFSGRMRSLVKVYISRNLFSSKYDYRDEWIRITRTLSNTESEESLPTRVILAIAEIVDSPSGALWLTRNDSHYDQVAQIEMGWVEGANLSNDDYVISYLKSSHQLMDLQEENPDFDRRKLPAWLLEVNKAWLIVPLESQSKLLGFVLLKDSRVDFDLNWEDYELLHAVGQQTASYLAQMLASEELSEARQFSAFNQGSAFVVHDIKTLNSQLSMLVHNAHKHKSNPAFIEDMIKTTEHAVSKMDFLLKHFRQESGDELDSVGEVDLVTLVSEVVQSQCKRTPKPEFRSDSPSLMVRANAAELKSAIGHLIQNAQEATPDDGRVIVSLDARSQFARLVISDTGCGMTSEFINTQLFRPFESTKGLTGMGIGVFQSRDYVRKLGGNLVVSSKPEEGTVFTITLPLAESERETLSGRAIES